MCLSMFGDGGSIFIYGLLGYYTVGGDAGVGYLFKGIDSCRELEPEVYLLGDELFQDLLFVFCRFVVSTFDSIV